MNRKPYSVLSNKQKKRRLERVFSNNESSQHFTASSEESSSQAATVLNISTHAKCSEDKTSISSVRPDSISNTGINLASLGHEHSERAGIFTQIDGQSNIITDFEPMDCNIEAHSEEFEQDACEAAAAITQLDCTTYVTNEAKIEAAITNWTFNNPKIPKQAISNLLHEMKLFYPSITLTANTLLKTDLSTLSYKNIYCGRYCHISDWIDSLAAYLQAIKILDDSVEIICNLDGIPLYNDSRKYHAYPILISTCTTPSKIFCAGVYLSENGYSNKMPDANDLLELFVVDLKKLLNEGVSVSGRKVSIILKAFVCDAPVRSAIKYIVNHNSYFGCERCNTKGSYSNGHVVLSELSANLKTDESFLKRDCPNHHKEKLSILCSLGVGMVTNFALDYMHLICIGVTKRLLTHIFSKKRRNCNYINSEKRENIETLVNSCSKSLPGEFSRKLAGGLTALAYWKASELRTFLLYIGVVVFKDLNFDQYINFLYLSIASRLLLSQNQQNNLENIRVLLKNFVKSSIDLYGLGFVSYNVHSVIHIPDDYEKWGPLDHVSCFNFESYLGSVVKGRLAGRNKPLEQISRHVTIENRNCNVPSTKQTCKKKLHIADKVFECGSLASTNDSCMFLKNGKVAILLSFAEDVMCLGIFKNMLPFFNDPVSSTKLGIYKVDKKILHENVPCSEILCKAVLFPYKEGFIALKMLHDI